MFTRKCRPRIAGWMLAVMFFSHAALAAFPCFGERVPAQAFAAAEAMECCAEADGGMGALRDNANACLAHCTADLQNVDAHQPTMLDAPPQAILRVKEPFPQGLALRHAVLRREVPPAPPPLILFQHFRI